jgi:hypothetical protein
MDQGKRYKAVMTFLLACFILALTAWPSPGLAQTAAKMRGWWPQDYNVQRDDAAGLLVLSTPYYRIEHDLKKGGALTRISLTHGKAPNLLVRPIETLIRLARREGAPDAPAQRGSRPQDIYSDLNNPAASVTHVKSGRSEVVKVESILRNEAGLEAGIIVKTTYTYRWGYIKIHKEFIVPKDPVRIRNLCVLSAVFDPSLSDYGHRPGVAEEMGADFHTWQNGQIRQWGKMRPGTHLDLPFQTRYVPRYLAFVNHGVEGIEWFAADDLSQWDYQITGEQGTSYCEISASLDPLGVAVSICPFSLSSRYELPRGGTVLLKETRAFDYYLGFPILEGHAYQPWLDKGFRANGGKWASEEEIRKNAESGLVTMRLHNDGDSNGDGLFWRDGSYPPYPPEEMKKMDQVIETCHKYGLKVAPYFSNHELHQSTEEFKKYGEEWGRKPDDLGNIRPNFYYGPLMCLKSGWFDFFKFSVDRVLKNHKFDGIYYDWNLAMFCNNPLHVGKTSTGLSGEKGLGALALSPTGHWDIDEFVQLVEWTRERVGPDGLVLLHNTLVPMFATENFANYIVGMEFTYNKLSVAMPKPAELPVEWNFGGARSRAVIGYGTIQRGAPPKLHKDYALTALLTSVAPWPATDEYIEYYKILKPLGDFEQYKFEDWRNRAVKLDAGECLSAVYSRAGEAYVLVANLETEPKQVRCIINSDKLPYPLASPRLAEILTRQGTVTKLDVDKLRGEGESLTIPNDDVIMIRLK